MSGDRKAKTNVEGGKGMLANSKKRVISFLLSLVMVISLLPVQAFATEPEEYPTVYIVGAHTNPVYNAEGEEVSIKEVHNLLKELVEGEDKSNPYTDEQLMNLLAERGFHVARRTIAKYREQLHIPVARMRR